MLTLMDRAIAWVSLADRLPSPIERRFLREQAGLSLDAMARQLGVSQSAVYRWEAGTRTPQGAALARYVELLEQLASPYNDTSPAGEPGSVTTSAGCGDGHGEAYP